MKRDTTCHLCVTHSALVSRVFEAAMTARDVHPRDVFSVSRRSAPLCGTGLRVDDISDEMDDRFKGYDRAGFRAARSRLDEALRGLVGGRRFIAYVPHLNRIIYQEIVLHPDCAGYCFLEEGFTSMAWSERRNSRTSAAKILRSFVRSRLVGARYRFSRRMFDHRLPHYLASFSVSPAAFLGMPGRTDVSCCLPPLPTGSPPGRAFVIVDAIYLAEGVNWRDYEDALVEALGSAPHPVAEVLVKFHFADEGASAKFESLRNRWEGADLPPLRLLGPAFPVEPALTRSDLLLFAFTALGYYAALSGACVLCFAARIRGLSLRTLVSKRRLPEDFARIVGLDRERLPGRECLDL